MKKSLLLSVVFGSLLLNIGLHATAPVSAASTYGNGTYGSCPFQQSCPTSPTSPSSAPPTPQSPATVNPTIIITTNVTDKTTVATSTYDVTAQLQQSVNGAVTPIPVTQIGWVVLYVDDKPVVTQYAPDSKGIYHLNWDLKTYPGSKVTLVAYGKDGTVMQRKDIRVTVTYKAPKPATPNSQPLSAETPHSKKVLSPLVEKILRTFPYWLFLVLLAMIVRLWWQSIQEVRAAERMRKVLAHEGAIFESKKDFIGLVSHYLRTPLTTINGGIDMLQSSLGGQPPAFVKLSSTSKSLSARVADLITHLENDSQAANISAPDFTAPGAQRPIRTMQFWILISSIILACAISELLLIYATTVDLTYIDVLIQVVLDIATAVFLLLGLRQHQVHHTEHLQAELAVQHQSALDGARNQFVNQASAMLTSTTGELEQALGAIGSGDGVNFIQHGVSGMHDLISKLELSTMVGGAGITLGNPTPVGLIALSQQALQSHENDILSKKLTAHLPHSEFQALSNETLVNYVINAVIDNAVKFNTENGSITIDASEQPGVITYTVQDTGIGIPADKQPDIFKPFVRATSVNQFDYEGIGLNLYLSKLIMQRLDGTIDIASTSDGTSVRLTFPVKL
jgi:signal transduction histidine kinase